MKRCLDDETLVRVLYGEATARQRRHVAACAQCAERRAAAARARDVATAVLGGAAIRPVTGLTFGRRGAAMPVRRRAARVVAPLALGAALAAALVLVLRPATRPAQTARASAAAELSLDDVARAFAVDDINGDDGSWLRADADDARWEAALAGERACDLDDGFGDSDCS